MISQTRGNGRGALNPAMSETADRQLEAQAVMRMAEVVQAADHIHTCFQGLGFASQGASAADQAAEALAEGGIEAFDESGIDRSLTLGFVDEGLDHGWAALHDPPGDMQLSCNSLLDHLHDGDIGPGNQPGSSQTSCAVWPGSPKGFAKGSHVAGQTIHGQQHGTAESHIADLVGQDLDQRQIPVRADRTP